MPKNPSRPIEGEYKHMPTKSDIIVRFLEKFLFDKDLTDEVCRDIILMSSQIGWIKDNVRIMVRVEQRPGGYEPWGKTRAERYARNKKIGTLRDMGVGWKEICTRYNVNIITAQNAYYKWRERHEEDR